MYRLSAREFKPKPLLEEVGWKRREKLQAFVFGNRWGNPRLFAMPRCSLLEGARPAVETEFVRTAQEKIDRKTKPKGSLGILEQVAVRLASLQLTLEPTLTRKRICVYAGTHGVTAEGVSAYPSTVTGQMVLNFLRGGAAINVLARHAGIELHVIDTGVDTTWPDEIANEPNFFSRPIRNGTRDFLNEPAMTPEECERAIDIGREQVRIAREQGVHLLGIGEMGIGNTTSASCLLAVLCGFSPDEAVGRGTGVSDAVLVRKNSGDCRSDRAAFGVCIRATRFLLATGRRRIRDCSDDGHNPRRCAGRPPHCRRWFHRNGRSGCRLSDGSEISRYLLF